MPAHALLPVLPPDYFSPGTNVMHGLPVGSLWACAYWQGWKYHFTRTRLGAPWRLLAIY